MYVPAPAGISQPGVPGRAFSRCTGLPAVVEIAGTVADGPLRLGPPHALRTSAAIAAPMARKVAHGVTPARTVTAGRGTRQRGTRSRRTTRSRRDRLALHPWPRGSPPTGGA